uniref:Putative secreted protein n=1 Tax=Ixodes ricinus TaxID=34613 RepID=A0A6B0TZY6_IXORI
MKSNWTISHGVWLSRLVLSAWVKAARANSQLLPGQKPYWKGIGKFDSSRWAKSRLLMTLSIVWQTMDVMEIGRYEWMSDLRGHRVPF